MNQKEVQRAIVELEDQIERLIAYFDKEYRETPKGSSTTRIKLRKVREQLEAMRPSIRRIKMIARELGFDFLRGHVDE